MVGDGLLGLLVVIALETPKRFGRSPGQKRYRCFPVALFSILVNVSVCHNVILRTGCSQAGSRLRPRILHQTLLHLIIRQLRAADEQLLRRHPIQDSPPLIMKFNLSPMQRLRIIVPLDDVVALFVVQLHSVFSGRIHCTQGSLLQYTELLNRLVIKLENCLLGLIGHVRIRVHHLLFQIGHGELFDYLRATFVILGFV